MASFSNHAFLLALLPLLIAALISANAGSPESSNSSRDFAVYRPETTIRIDAKMGHGRYVVARCWSSEEDRGLKKMVDGQFYSWRFQPNIWGTTKYICALAWQKGTLMNVFYEYNRDISRCGADCRWFANTTAVYGIIAKYGEVDMAFAWQPVPDS
ncbi:hypothetical protein Ancab_030838 [Ancistrocladus abbreviatus]